MSRYITYAIKVDDEARIGSWVSDLHNSTYSAQRQDLSVSLSYYNIFFGLAYLQEEIRRYQLESISYE